MPLDDDWPNGKRLQDHPYGGWLPCVASRTAMNCEVSNSHGTTASSQHHGEWENRLRSPLIADDRGRRSAGPGASSGSSGVFDRPSPRTLA
jgi:hypothetical protein